MGIKRTFSIHKWFSLKLFEIDNIFNTYRVNNKWYTFTEIEWYTFTETEEVFQSLLHIFGNNNIFNFNFSHWFVAFTSYKMTNYISYILHI